MLSNIHATRLLNHYLSQSTLLKITEYVVLLYLYTQLLIYHI